MLSMFALVLACALVLPVVSASEAQRQQAPSPQAAEERKCIDASLGELIAAAGQGRLEAVARHWASALYCRRYKALAGDAYVTVDGALNHVVHSLTEARDSKALARLRDEFRRMAADGAAQFSAAAVPGMFMVAAGRRSAGDQTGAMADVDFIARFLRTRSGGDAAFAEILERWAERLRVHGDNEIADALMKHAPVRPTR